MVIINVQMSVGRIKNLCVGDADRSLSDTSSRGGLSDRLSDMLRRFPVSVSLRFQFDFGVVAFFGKRLNAGHRPT